MLPEPGVWQEARATLGLAAVCTLTGGLTGPQPGNYGKALAPPSSLTGSLSFLLLVPGIHRPG